MLKDFHQFLLLLWKCYLLRKHHFITSLFELISPILFNLLSLSVLSSVNLREQETEAVRFPRFPENKANLCRGTINILYCPFDTITRNFTHELIDVIECQVNSSLGFKSEKELVDYFNNVYSKRDFDASKVYGFNLEKFSSDTIRLKIRSVMPYYDYPYSNSRVTYNHNTDYHKFMAFQTYVGQAVVFSICKITPLTIHFQRFPYPKRKLSGMSYFSSFMSVTLISGFLFSYIIIIKRIIEEKQNRMREMIKMIGVHDFVYWSSLFINYFIFFILQSVVITFLNIVPFRSTIKLSNGFIIYFGFLCYGAQLILSAMLISIPFKSSTYSIFTAFIFYIFQAIPAYCIMHSSKLKLFSSFPLLFFVLLLPNSSGALLIGFILNSESIGREINSHNLFDEFTLFGKFSYGSLCISMLVSCVILAILILYLESVWPWQFGAPKPLCFPFMNLLPVSTEGALNQDFSYLNKPMFEMDNVPYTEGIMIRNLKKSFTSGLKSKVVVDNLCLDVRKGNITILLGHNGAGKTTTMSIITGMIAPTSGTVLINGYDITTQRKKAISKISLCPQYNFMYDELTLKEHLKLFGLLKNESRKQINDSINETAKALKLAESLDKPAYAFSGGMQRRLCLGMALIGNTEILILDEPTSGLDPETRREIWNILLNIRLKKTVLLTTHYMEEADALGDKVAIMSAGNLKCFGAPIFLKRVLGTGYQIRFAKDPPNFDLDLLNKSILTYFPNSAMLNNTENEISFALNQTEESKKKEDASIFGTFFDVIEKSKENLGVTSWGLSMTTLEDVFLKVDNIQIESKEIDEIKLSPKQFSRQTKRLEGFMLFTQSIKGLLIKRLQYVRRNWIMLILQITFPMLFFMLLFKIDRILFRKQEVFPIKLDINEIYGNTIGFYHDHQQGKINFRYEYRQSLKRHNIDPIYIHRNYSVEDYLLKLSEHMDLVTYTSKFLIGLDIINENEYTIWYNNEAFHSGPLSLNIFFETFILYYCKKLFHFEVINHPFNLETDAELGFILTREFAKRIWQYMVQIPLLFLAASYTLFPTYEKISKAKLLQLMTGLSPLAYWISNYIFDICILIISIFMIFFVTIIFDSFKFLSHNVILMFTFFIVLMIFGISAISLSYLVSLVSKKPTGGFILLISLYFIGIFYSIFLELIRALNLMKKYQNILFFIARLIPTYSVSVSILDIYENTSQDFICKLIESKCGTVNNTMINKCCKNLCGDDCFKLKNPLSLEMKELNISCLIMLIEGILIFLLLMFCEYGLHFFIVNIKNYKEEMVKTPLISNNEDSDVINEKNKVNRIINSNQMKSESLVVFNLAKNFKKFKAVKGITFLIHHNECFGLLGVNGAGKTTTFRMLVGEILPSSGIAYIGENNIIDSIREFQKCIGYCPQYDALLEDLTGEEMLYLYARLRGIPEDYIKDEISQLISMADLDHHYQKQLKNCSGGNKRKFSLALSIIGNPKLLFLDEPTTGVDPVGRRKIWALLNFFKQKRNVSILLTTHSMDECEALCSRIAIMAAGTFQCIGSLQHLRDKFGQAYYLFIKLKRDQETYIHSVMTYIRSIFPSAVLKNRFQKNMEYNITNRSLKWSFLFNEMEKIKIKFDLEDYILTDTSLEQIFLSFARKVSMGV